MCSLPPPPPNDLPNDPLFRYFSLSPERTEKDRQQLLVGIKS